MWNFRIFKFSVLMPAIYLFICLGVWIQFANTNHDGLANIGLVLITMPLSVFELAIEYQIFGSYDQFPMWRILLRKIGFPTGYLMDHAYWYVPLASCQAYFLFRVGRCLEKIKNRKFGKYLE